MTIKLNQYLADMMTQNGFRTTDKSYSLTALDVFFLCLFFIVFSFLLGSSEVLAANGAQTTTTENPSSSTDYLVNPGDVLSIYVWNEKSLNIPELLVTPDGNINIPIAGKIKAGGRSTSSIEESISSMLFEYLRDKPNVTVSIVSLTGNVVSVLGQVNRPGQFIMRGLTDVTQALALAGGLTAFADDNSIKILRRDSSGKQKAIEFRYNKVSNGKHLSENLILRSGDVVLVP
ncbi:MAG: polysaccharide biosynthesis/export family protein [Cellvibrionaceae bacterium]